MDVVRDLAEIFALVAVAFAGAAFFVKAANGWLYANLSIELDSSRVPLEIGVDVLAIKLSLSKGNRGSIDVEHIAVEVLSYDVVQESTGIKRQEPPSTKRSDGRGFDGSPQRQAAESILRPIAPESILQVEKGDSALDGERSLRLTPGEETHFGHWETVDSGTASLIVASVEGRTMSHFPERLRRRCHWRVTAISAPLVPPSLRSV